MAAVCRSTCGETRFCSKEEQFFRARAAYLVTRYWTESELKVPPRALGNRIFESSLPNLTQEHRCLSIRAQGCSEADTGDSDESTFQWC
jgi:hypothetical protein